MGISLHMDNIPADEPMWVYLQQWLIHFVSDETFARIVWRFLDEHCQAID